jgi:PAS domain S-box-containing protein
MNIEMLILFIDTIIILIAMHIAVSEYRRAKDFEIYYQAIELSDIGLIAVDSKGIITKWNAGAEKIFGWSTIEVVGEDMAELIIPLRYRDQHYTGFKYYLDTGKNNIFGKTLSLSGLKKNGKEFDLKIIVNRIQLRGNRIMCVALIKNMENE